MSGWSDLFLGVIAITTLAMAVVQISVLVEAGRLARRIGRLADQVERDLSPLIASLDSIGQDAARAAALATAQVERVDRLFADVTQRAEALVGSVQAALAVPVREGAALMSGIRAVLDSLRRGDPHRPPRTRGGEDDDALFV